MFPIILQITRQDRVRFAILPQANEVSDQVFFSQLAHILMGNHPLSSKLLYPAESGTSFAQLGADHALYVCFYSPPENIDFWVTALKAHLPPSYKLIGGTVLMRVGLASPQEGAFYAVYLGVTQKK